MMVDVWEGVKRVLRSAVRDPKFSMADGLIRNSVAAAVIS